MTRVSNLLLVWLLLGSISRVEADLPIHCLKAQVEGTWRFRLGPSKEVHTLADGRCGFDSPSGVRNAMANVPDDSFKVDSELMLKLDEYASVVDAKNRKRGTWTMMYDEGMILDLEDISLFVFFRFSMENGKGKSDCSKTLIGWYRRQDKSMGCFFGEQIISAHADISKTSTGEFVQGVATRVLRSDAIQVALARTYTFTPKDDLRSVLANKDFYLDFREVFAGPGLARLPTPPPAKTGTGHSPASPPKPAVSGPRPAPHKPATPQQKQVKARKNSQVKDTKTKKNDPKPTVKSSNPNKTIKASSKVVSKSIKVPGKPQKVKLITGTEQKSKPVVNKKLPISKPGDSSKASKAEIQAPGTPLPLQVSATTKKPQVPLKGQPSKLPTLLKKPISVNGTKPVASPFSKKTASDLHMVDLLKKEKEVKPWEDKSLELDDKKYHVRSFSMNMNLEWIQPKMKREVHLAQVKSSPVQESSFDSKAFVQSLNQASLGWEAEDYPFLAGKSEQEINFFSGRVGPVRYEDEMKVLKQPELEATSVQFAETSEEELPKEFSLLKHLSSVKAQDSCGNCYLIATIGMLEARIRYKTGRDFALSTQYVNDCNHYAQGCEGGFSLEVLRFAEEFFVPREACKPYLALQARCSGHCDLAKEAEVLTAEKGYYVGGRYGATTERGLMRELLARGPVVASFEPKPSFAFYKRGVYRPLQQTVEQRFGGGSQWVKVDHSVLLYGWGEEHGVKFWRVRNSWGQRWGEAGDFRILRGANALGIESVGEAAVPHLVPL